MTRRQRRLVVPLCLPVIAAAAGGLLLFLASRQQVAAAFMVAPNVISRKNVNAARRNIKNNNPRAGDKRKRSFPWAQQSFQSQPNGRHDVPVSSSSSSSSSSALSMAIMPFSMGSIASPFKLVLNKLFSWTVSASVFLLRELRGMTRTQKILSLGFFMAGFLAGRIVAVHPFWKRYTSIVDIPSMYYGEKAPILTGRAVSVSDGDTIRFLHTPTPFHPLDLQKEKQEKASNTALPIRICTIDTPETAKFGKPGQPFGNEAKENLADLLQGEPVKVRLLRSDQYGRGVGQVFVEKSRRFLPFLTRRIYADEHQLKAGLAEVYQGAGAVYGSLAGGLTAYLQLEQAARKEKAGMWSQGKKRESAADYKKRTKQ